MGLGDFGLKDVGRGDARTWGLRDAGTRGPADWGTCGRGNAGKRGSGNARTRGRDKQATLDFCIEFVKYKFSVLLRKVLYAGEFVSTLVANFFQRSCFGLIGLLAYFTIKKDALKNRFISNYFMLLSIRSLVL